MEDGRQIIVTQTIATLQVYADRTGIRLGSVEEWKYPRPKSKD